MKRLPGRIGCHLELLFHCVNMMCYPKSYCFNIEYHPSFIRASHPCVTLSLICHSFPLSVYATNKDLASQLVRPDF